MTEPPATITAAGALLARLKAVGVDYIFANSGTDFPPIIEGLAEATAKNLPLPTAIVVPHESAAMGMAYGYFLATGRAQAVMVHTNVGLANCAIGAINAALEHNPVLLFSGRTPVLEKGRLGARSVPIGWGQEMRDQAALIREASKWDYELRFPEQALDIIDRAYAIALSTPKGPVYLSLPREVLCEHCSAEDLAAPSRMAPAIAAPAPSALEEAVKILIEAKRPLIVAQRGAGNAEAFAILSDLADTWAIPVVHYWALQLAVASDHPMAVGTEPLPWVAEADAILVLDALAPWSRAAHPLRADCKVIHVGPDPLYRRIPVRNFPADVALVGEVADVIASLSSLLRPHHAARSAALAERRKQVASRAGDVRTAAIVRAETGVSEPMTKAWVALCLSHAIKGRGARVLSELGCPLGPMTLSEHDAWYQEPHSGGLGWAFPAALGMQLARRDRLTIATMGDGSYMFANPVACHQIAEALQLPVLLLVLNNAEWRAVRQSVLDIYPDGYAARANTMPLISLEPSPDFTKVAQASRAWTARVDNAGDLPAVLSAAIDHVTLRRSHALVDIRVGG
jgi:acetolactate synthase I/II/III large subunit